MTFKREITINELGDLIPFLQEEADNYRGRDHDNNRDRTRAHARGYAEGVEWCIAVIRDTRLDIGDGSGE